MAWMARRGTLVLIVVIGLLLPALAALQYRWTGEISRLEQVRAMTNIDAAAQRFSTEFDEMLAAVYAQYYGRLPEARGAGHHVASEPAAPRPALARQVLVISRDGRGGFPVRELDADGRPGARVPWPDWLDPTPTAAAGGAEDAPLPRGLQRTLLDEVPALVVRRGTPHDEWIVVVLDLPRIVDEVLPAMLGSHLEGGVPVEYDVLINREDVPDHVLFRSRPDLTPADFAAGVNLMPVFGIHSRDLDPEMARGLMPDAAAHRWRLFLKARDGSLEAAVDAARRRNLWIGASVLALLALSVALLVASVSRVQRAAQDSLELVARISHELRTPLSTITCAGENLADNVVANAEETRHYGRIIQQEGRRLHKTITDILLCCRLQTRADTVLSLRPTRIDEVIAGAIEDSRIVTATTAPLTCTVDPRLPMVMADADALRAAIKNLVVNAVKHGRHTPVSITARAERGGQVAIDVEDRGPGIPDEELPHVFDPFFRGRRARDGQVDGSGIGLNVVYQVVRSHGGKIRVARAEPHGTRFTVQVPGLPTPPMPSPQPEPAA
jgi:two-component system phosphate regulon sensor histidine kinase PhoR